MEITGGSLRSPGGAYTDLTGPAPPTSVRPVSDQTAPCEIRIGTVNAENHSYIDDARSTSDSHNYVNDRRHADTRI